MHTFFYLINSTDFFLFKFMFLFFPYTKHVLISTFSSVVNRIPSFKSFNVKFPQKCLPNCWERADNFAISQLVLPTKLKFRQPASQPRWTRSAKGRCCPVDLLCSRFYSRTSCGREKCASNWNWCHSWCNIAIRSLAASCFESEWHLQRASASGGLR